MMRGPILALATLTLVAGANADESLPAGSPVPVVVELFTSQSCYSCPPAEAYLGDLADRPGILALEWHVDYWNDITYGSAGQWIDPFSSSANTQRQALYNQRIRGTNGVYTPQMVIDGRFEAVGSREHDVEAAIAAAGDRPHGTAVASISAEGAGLAIALDGQPGDAADLILVRFIAEHVTEVPRGENHGKTLVNHHIVTAVETLGSWAGGAAAYTAAAPQEGEGCALLIQTEGQGPILAAATCPMPTS